MTSLKFPGFIAEENYIGVALAQIALIRLRYLDETVFDSKEGPYLGFMNDDSKRAISNFKADQGVRPVNFTMDENFTKALNKSLFLNNRSNSEEGSISESDLENVIVWLESARANLALLQPARILNELSESALEMTQHAFNDIHTEVKASLERECN